MPLVKLSANRGRSERSSLRRARRSAVRLTMHTKAPFPMSIADREAMLWDNGPLIKFAYWYDVSKFPVCPEGQYKSPAALFESFRDSVLEAQGKKPATRARHRTLGDLGEYFAAIMFGITLHKNSTAQGSDGKSGNDFVEVKTITPGKKRDLVWFKRSSHFSKIVVVKITSGFQFGARMVARSILKSGDGKRVQLYWDDMIVGCGAKAMEVHRSFPLARRDEALGRKC